MSSEHDGGEAGRWPHSGGCDGCRRGHVCNACGAHVTPASRCTNGRCLECHAACCTVGGATNLGHGYGPTVAAARRAAARQAITSPLGQVMGYDTPSRGLWIRDPASKSVARVATLDAYTAAQVGPEIVHRWNAHERLVEMAQRLLPRLKLLEESYEPGQPERKDFDDLVTLLAEVRS